MAYLMIFWMILLFDLFVSYTFTVVLQLQCGRTARGIRANGSWYTTVHHVADAERQVFLHLQAISSVIPYSHFPAQKLQLPKPKPYILCVQK